MMGKSIIFTNILLLFLIKVCIVSQTNRVSHETQITFVNDQSDLLDLFSLFEPYFVGSYDITMREGSRFHYAYLGRKKY